MLSTILGIISGISGTCAAVALGWNAYVFRKEQKNVQVTLLADFIARATELLDKQKEYEKEGKLGFFCVLFLGHLEWLAYLVNNDYLSFEMADLYRGMVINWYEKVLIKQKDVLSEYLEEHPQSFSELESLYQKMKTT